VRQNQCLVASRSITAALIGLWPDSGQNLAQSGCNFSYRYILVLKYLTICYSYVLVCYSYVLECYSYVTRMYLCGVLVTIPYLWLFFWFLEVCDYSSDADSYTECMSKQRPRKHFESGGALAKRGTFVYDQNRMILCRSGAGRKCLKIWSLYDVGNSLYRVFTTAKRALSFQQKRAFTSRILFSFFKWGTSAQKKGHFFHF
jgi:hypothetical protein